MSLQGSNAALSETESLRRELAAANDRLARLSDASISILQNPDPEGALQWVLDSTSSLTGARYGVLMTVGFASADPYCFASGFTVEEHDTLKRSSRGLELLERPDGTKGPFRINEVDSNPDYANLLAILPDVKTVLGIPLYHHDEHVGSLYLMNNDGDREFTDADENVAAMFAAQAVAIATGARRYEDAYRDKMDYETMLDLCPISITLTDVRSGAVSYTNEASRRLVGSLASDDEDLGNFFLSTSFTRPDGRELAFSELPGSRALQSGETVPPEEIVVHRPDGTSFTTLVGCTPVFSSLGELASVLTVTQDVTSLKHQESKRTEIVGMVCEELRTPITSIKGSAAALQSVVDPSASAEALQLVRIIDQQADLMRSQINSLVELAQIQTGTLSVAARPNDVADLIEGACNEYLGNHSAVNFKVEIAEGLATVAADRPRITEVLHNLFRHAAVHSSEAYPVVVSAVASDIHVAISVSADGPPVEPEDVRLPAHSSDSRELFNSLLQSHNKAAELASKGEGLPMAFCRGVVEAHGGRINTRIDEETGGLTLTFTLPTVEETDETRAEGSANASGDRGMAQAEATKILVSVEDNRLARTVRTVLLDAGFDTVSVPDLEDVEEAASLERPKLIIMDIGGREEESFQTLRGAGDSMNVPAIILCDRIDEETVIRAFDMGADGYMVKPFSPSEMIARIRATLRRLNATGDQAGGRTFEAGELTINFDARTVELSGESVSLTATEYKLIIELANNAGRVITQDALLDRIWGPEYVGDSHLLRAYVKSLRRKIGDNARTPTFIFTERGVGYRMVRTLSGDEQG